jgi:hypothetical protein
MSACSASDRRRRVRSLAIAGVVLAAGALIVSAGTAPAAARSLAHRDSGRVVGKIVINDQGIQIEGQDAGDGSGGVHVDINPDVRVRAGRLARGRRDSTDSGASVRIGPGIVVDANESGLVRVFADAEVPVGDRIEGDVVAVFGSVDVKGQVAGNVVAVGGSVHLDPGAAVEGDVVAVGGVLDQAKGSSVGGESVSLGFFPIAWGVPTLPVLLLGVLAGLLLSLFMGWLLHLIFPERMLRVAVTASRRTAVSFLLGIVSLPLMLFTVMLLFITVIGIPIAFLLPVFYALLVWGGQLAATTVLGSKILRQRLGQGGAMKPLFAGALFVAMFFAVGAVLASPPGFVRTVALFFGLLGVLLLVALSTIGAGAFLLSRLGSSPADVHPERGSDTAPLPVPAAGAAMPPATPGA